MDFYGTSHQTHSSSLSSRALPPAGQNDRNQPLQTHGETGLEESLLRMRIQTSQKYGVPAGPYPVRPGQPDCAYYLRNGTCGFGANCHFNHPPPPKLEMLASAPQMEPGRQNEDLPERPGQSECPFYMKTGTCKFGAACKFHHTPRKSPSASGQLQFNFLGLPLRPGEKECAYFVQTGSCKFGAACKYHHPQPSATGSVPSPVSSPLHSTSRPISPVPVPIPVPVPVPYQAGVPSWPVARAPFVPAGSPMPGSVGYMPVLVSSPQNMSVPGWNGYNLKAPLTQTFPSSDTWQQMTPKGVVQGATTQADARVGLSGSGSTIQLPKPVVPQNEPSFPIREGQPDCHHFMKTGDCKYGANCKYNHPKDGASSLSSALNPMGLPLRPGQQPCSFYIKHGICKFGPVCKYDHPVGGLRHNPSASSLHDAPVFPYSSGSSPTSATTSSQRFSEATKVEEPVQSISSKQGSQSGGMREYDQGKPAEAPYGH